MLNDEQRYIILRGIKEGKQKYEELTNLLPYTITKKHAPFFQSDLVNTYVAKQIKENPHTQMKVYTQKSGSHPYIVVQDTIRNIYVLISKFPKNKYIPNPSDYRGDFSLSNVERLLEMGASIEEIYGKKIPYQEFLPLGIENQPFGIIICYDGKSDTVFEGALRPDQEDWIYKENISEYLNINTETIVPLNNYHLSDIQTSLKELTEDDIVLKLKEKTTS